MLARLILKNNTLIHTFTSRSMVSLYNHEPKRAPKIEMNFPDYVESINRKLPAKFTRAASKSPLRCGVIGYKQGMTSLFNKWGVHIPCSVIQVFFCLL